MKNKTEVEELRERIVYLKQQQKAELELVQQQFYSVCENLKPINIIKNTFKDVVAAPSIKHRLLKGALGLVTGYLSKKIWVGSSHNPIRKVVGTVLEFVVANFVTNRADAPSK
jgi:hypothetical protein